MKKYDAIIIGAGSAGLGCLGMAKELGWTSMIVDKDEANIGGDCLNFGCVPSKALIHVAKQFEGARKASEFGLAVSGQADWSKVINFVHEKQATIRAHESAEYLRSHGENLVIGEAHFIDEHSIEVNGEHYQADKFFICTGSHPRVIPFDGLDQVAYYTNETLFYDLKALPERLLVVGGGPIGCEMAQVFQRLGSQVILLDRGDRILGKEREEMSHILADQLTKEGLEIILEHDLKGFDSATSAIITNKSSQEEISVNFDACLLAIGRGLNHGSLQLEKANVELTERKKIKVNDYLQSNQKHIYVVGDAVGSYQFSHGAEKHVNLLRHNFKSMFDKKHHIKGLSWVTFTDPEIATFGFSEEYLKENKISYWRQDQEFSRDDRAITSDYSYGKMTLFVTTDRNKSSRKILGGSLIAPMAGDIMQELHLATITDLCLDDFLKKVYAYPTASRINQQTIKGIVDYKG